MKRLNFKTEEIAANYEHLYDLTMQLWPKDGNGYYVETQFGKTWINEVGDESKPVLLLLHGMSSSSTVWYSNVEQLSKHFRVLAPDIIGQAGKSISESPLKSSNDLVKWLDEVIEKLQLTKVYLAGMSFGGWLAIRYTLYNSKKISKLVVLDPAGTLAPMCLEFYLRMYAMLLIPKFGDSFTNWIAQGYEMNADFLNQMEVGIQDYAAVKGQKNILPSKISSKQLNNIKVPLLILLGEKCVIYKPKKVIKKAESISNVTVEVIVNCAHSMNMENPQLINQKIINFILPQM